MADLTVTPANVRPGSGQPKKGIAAAAILAGQSLYKLGDGTIGLFDANGTAPANVLVGVAVNSAPGVGQPVEYIDSSVDFEPGATTVAGTPYVGSATPGGICPHADLVTGCKAQLVGFGATGNKLAVNIYNSNQTVP